MMLSVMFEAALLLILSSAHSPVPARNVSKFVGLFARNCLELQRQGVDISNVYTIYPYDTYPEHPVQVFCDMETEGGGWMVIQRRADLQPRVDSYQTLIEYELGFGDLGGEFWLGLNHIHALTDQTLQEIRFDLQDFEGESRHANYRSFYVHNKASNYLLEANGYSGNAGDSFTSHDGQYFSTKDHVFFHDGLIAFANNLQSRLFPKHLILFFSFGMKCLLLAVLFKV